MDYGIINLIELDSNNQ